MGTQVGTVELGVRLNESLAQDTSKVANKASNLLNDKFSKIGSIIGKALAVTALVRFGAHCVKLGSDLAEVQNVVDVTFPHMSEQVNNFAKEAISSFGLSQKVAKEYIGQLGSMAQAFGFNEKASYDMASAITGLTGDVASFYNLSSDESFVRLKSIFTGETESLKTLGVVMTQSALDEFALANGFNKTTAQMSEQEKVTLRLAFVQNALSNASGDFARTSDGWANSTRVLTLRFREFMATLGQGLINLLAPLIRIISVVIAKLQVLATYFLVFTHLLTGKKGATSATGTMAKNLKNAGKSAGGLSSGLGKAGKAAGTVADNLKKAQGFLAGFDELNVVSAPTPASSGSGDGGGSAGGGGGAIGDLDFGNEASLKPTIKTDELEKAYQKVKAIFDKIVNFLRKKKVIITSILGGLFVGFAVYQIITKWSSLVALFTKLVKPIMFLKTAFVTLWGSISQGSGLMTGIQAVFGTAAGTALIIAAAVAAISAALIYLYQTSEPFRNLVNDAFKSLMDILANLRNNVLAPLGAFLKDVFDTVIVPICEILGSVFVKAVDVVFSILMTLWNAVLAPIANFLIDTLGVALNFVIGVWNEWKPGIQLIMDLLKKLWDNILSPIVDFIKNTICTVIKELGSIVKLVIDNALNIFRGFAEFLTGVFTGNVEKMKNGVLMIFYSILNFLGHVFGIKFAAVFQGVVFVVNTFFEGVKSVFAGVRNIFSGIIDFITGIFTGNWSRAWNGVVKIFAGIFQCIVGYVKAPLNVLISAINWIIDKVNSVNIKVPDWVPLLGGKRFGINIPRIPMLANGGYLGANTPRLALVGDNRHEGEIVSPESKIYEQTKRAIDEALAMKNSNDNLSASEVIIQLLYELLDTIKNLGLEVDTDKILKIIYQRKKQLELARGV